LGENLGRFSFREWTLATTFTQKGDAILMVRASNNNAEVQPLKADWNPGGYRRHAIESTAVTIF
ncbi:MAG: oxidase, partial [Methyloprofundus sp.]